jgi:hypothetical protein
MASVFWDRESILLVEFLKTGAKTNSEWYVQTLKKLKQRTQWVQPTTKMNQVIFSLQSQFITLWLPPVWSPETCHFHDLQDKTLVCVCVCVRERERETKVWYFSQEFYITSTQHCIRFWLWCITYRYNLLLLDFVHNVTVFISMLHDGKSPNEEDNLNQT